MFWFDTHLASANLAPTTLASLLAAAPQEWSGDDAKLAAEVAGKLPVGAI